MRVSRTFCQRRKTAVSLVTERARFAHVLSKAEITLKVRTWLVVLPGRSIGAQKAFSRLVVKFYDFLTTSQISANTAHEKLIFMLQSTSCHSESIYDVSHRSNVFVFVFSSCFVFFALLGTERLHEAESLNVSISANS